MNKNKKKVPKLRFPGFTDEWEQRKLGEEAQIIMGQSPNSENYTNNPSDWILVQGNADIKNGWVTPRVWTKQITKKAAKGNLILSVRAPVGDVGKTDYDIVIGRGVAAINGNEFIFQQLKKMKNNGYWNRYSTGSTFESINSNNINEARIVVPSKREQEKIGIFFKQLDDLITLHQRKLEDTKKLKQALLQKMFPKEGEKVPELRFPGFLGDWEQLSLSKVVAGNISDGDWIEKEHIYDEGEYRIIQTGNLGSNGEYVDKPNNAKFFYQKDFDELKANEIFPGDVLISRLAAPAGRTIILPETGYRMVTAVDVAVIRPNDNFDSYYLKTLMNSEKLINLVSKKVTGTTHKRISRKNLERVLLDVPICFEEQQKIGSFFKYLDNLISLHQQKLDHLNQQKKALLQQMFI